MVHEWSSIACIYLTIPIGTCPGFIRFASVCFVYLYCFKAGFTYEEAELYRGHVVLQDGPQPPKEVRCQNESVRLHVHLLQKFIGDVTVQRAQVRAEEFLLKRVTRRYIKTADKLPLVNKESSDKKYMDQSSEKV